jgi:23S rRNA pseudouridine1911/1915/1917 synthase
LHKHVFTVTGEERDMELATLLVARLRLSGCSARVWIAGGSVFLDGRRCVAGETRLRPGQRVVAHEPVAQDSRAPAPPLVVYRDTELAALDKPAGLPSQATRRGGTSTVEDFLRAELGPEARLAHRLDAAASGLLLATLSAAARRSVADQLQQRTLQRAYLAVVQGIPREPELLIRSRLGVHGGQTRSSADERAHLAETRAHLLRTARSQGRALLQVELSTGRTHQIRAHLAEQGLPLVGDERYGGPRGERLALHAHRLCLRDFPTRGARLELHSPLPATLRAMLEEEGQRSDFFRPSG